MAMVLILIFAEVLGLYGCAASPILFLFLLIPPPQIDCGAGYEHKGDRVDVLIVTFSSCNLRLLSIACECPTTSVVYVAVQPNEEARGFSRRTKCEQWEPLSMYLYSKI